MAKIQAGELLDLIVLSKAEAKVGDYKWSHLDPTPFSNEHLGQWMFCNGQSSAGTEFESITGQSVVPNAVDDGTFLRQAKAGRNAGTFEADALKDHKHQIPISSGSYPSGSIGGPTSASYGGGSGGSFAGGNTATTNESDETRPKNIAANLYVKVGY